MLSVSLILITFSVSVRVSLGVLAAASFNHYLLLLRSSLSMLAHLAHLLRELVHMHVLTVLVMTLPPVFSLGRVMNWSSVCLSNVVGMLLSLLLHDFLVGVLFQMSWPLLVCLCHLLSHDLLESTVTPTRWNIESLLFWLSLTVHLLLFFLIDDPSSYLLLSRFLESSLGIGLPLDVVEFRFLEAFSAELLANGREDLDLIVYLDSVVQDRGHNVLGIGRPVYGDSAVSLGLPNLLLSVQTPEVHFSSKISKSAHKDQV